MSRFVLSVFGLTAVYCLALASADPWDIGLGMVLSVAVLTTFRRFLFTVPPIPAADLLRRIVHLPRLILATSANIIRGTVTVARVVLTPGPVRGQGLVTVPIGERTSEGVVVSGLLETLSPGSVLVDVDPEDGAWEIHALNAMSPDALIADLQEFYEEFQRPVLP